MNRKIIGLSILVVFACAMVFGAVGSVMEVIEAASAVQEPVEGEYVARLASENEDDPALAALKYVCPFH